MLLPDSELYDILSMLPEPDPTNPTSTTTLLVQEAVYNSLPTLEDIVELLEKDEAETINSEIQKRRTRLNAPSAQQLKKDVGLEVWSSSKVNLLALPSQISFHPMSSCPISTTKYSTIPTHLTHCDVKLIANCYGTSKSICMLYQLQVTSCRRRQEFVPSWMP